MLHVVSILDLQRVLGGDEWVTTQDGTNVDHPRTCYVSIIHHTYTPYLVSIRTRCEYRECYNGTHNVSHLGLHLIQDLRHLISDMPRSGSGI